MEFRLQHFLLSLSAVFLIFSNSSAFAAGKKLDLNNKEHDKAIQNYSDDYLDTSLELGIQHFQEKEEYEKCAQILKILKISQEI